MKNTGTHSIHREGNKEGVKKNAERMMTKIGQKGLSDENTHTHTYSTYFELI